MLTLILSTSLFTYDIFPPGDPKLTQSPQPEKELIIYGKYLLAVQSILLKSDTQQIIYSFLIN